MANIFIIIKFGEHFKTYFLPIFYLFSRSSDDEGGGDGNPVMATQPRVPSAPGQLLSAYTDTHFPTPFSFIVYFLCFSYTENHNCSKYPFFPQTSNGMIYMI